MALSLLFTFRSDFLTIATTRPETLFADVAIAVNPLVREPLRTLKADYMSPSTIIMKYLKVDALGCEVTKCVLHFAG